MMRNNNFSENEKRIQKQIKKNNLMSNGIILMVCILFAIRFLVLCFTNQAEGITGTITTCCYVVAFVAFLTIAIFRVIKIKNLMN